MRLYIETDESGVYGLVDTFINETIILNTKTTYVQDITAVFKGFTNNFSVQATPNNIKLLDYFSYTDRLTPTNVKKRAKLYIDEDLFREGIITLEGASWINEEASLFELSFSDGQKNLSEVFGEDSLNSLEGGDITWNSRTIANGLQGIQTSTSGVRWFVPFVSVNRIFTLYNSLVALPTDNINYTPTKPITSENVLLANEVRPAVFFEDILKAIEQKYGVRITPEPLANGSTQITDLATMCVGANVAVAEVKAELQKTIWDIDRFKEIRFDIIPKPLINAFELRYLGDGFVNNRDPTFAMAISLKKDSNTFADDNFINYIEVFEVNPDGSKKKKLNYTILKGAETRRAFIKIQMGLDIFFPEGGNAPSTLIKPLISVFVSAESLANWRNTNFVFDWRSRDFFKGIYGNVQPTPPSNNVSLFGSLPEMKVIDFVKSVYTMFGYKFFKAGISNDFIYKYGGRERVENDLTPFADLSKVTKKTNTKYDAYDLKHVTSEYQQNKAFAIANGQEWGQIKFPKDVKGKQEFKIETKFTAPVLSPVATDNQNRILTFYPFGEEAKLNESETRFVYEPIVKEFPIFYYNGVDTLTTNYAFVDSNARRLLSMNRIHKISHRSNRIFTSVDNYITSLFNIITGDYIDQNTLYVQTYKDYIEDTLSGKKLIHTIDLELPSTEIQKFDNDQDIIIKETKYSVLESSVGLTDNKVKLTLLNK